MTHVFLIKKVLSWFPDATFKTDNRLLLQIDERDKKRKQHSMNFSFKNHILKFHPLVSEVVTSLIRVFY